MTSNINCVRESQIAPDSDVLSFLRAEIEFWKETIATCSVSQTAECVERMHQALALAEHKLAKMTAKPVMNH